MRYQALFSEAGGIDRGQRRNRVRHQSRYGVTGFHWTTAMRWSASPSTASTRSGRTPPHTSGPERCSVSGCWPWSLRAAARSTRVNAIPTSRTSSPYSLTDAVSDLTTNTAGTDTESLNQSLDTLSATLDQIAPQLGPTFDGLSRLSQSLNNRNESLAELLKTAARRHRDPLRAQRAGQRADPQRQRPGRRARTSAATRSSACSPTRRRYRSN